MAFLPLWSGCADNSEQNPASVSSNVIYETDDREELARSQYAGLGVVAMALIPVAELRSSGRDGDGKWAGLGAPLDWCVGQRFADQPSAAICGGVALGGNYVLTASHCVPDRATCQQLTFARGYALDAAGQLSADQLERYACDDVVLSVKSDLVAPQAFDFSIVRLTRPVSDLPSAWLAIGAVNAGERTVCVAPSSGLPLKVSTGEIFDVNVASGFFHTSVDFFAGGSGSGLFNERGELLGIMVTGSSDYVEGPDGCLSARIVDAGDGDSGELGNDVGSILHEACERRPDLPFCDGAAGANTTEGHFRAASPALPGSCAMTSARGEAERSREWAAAVIAFLVVVRLRRPTKRANAGTHRRPMPRRSSIAPGTYFALSVACRKLANEAFVARPEIDARKLEATAVRSQVPIQPRVTRSACMATCRTN